MSQESRHAPYKEGEFQYSKEGALHGGTERPLSKVDIG